MDKNFFLEVFGRRVGFQYSPVKFYDGKRYMDRFVSYTGLGSLRLHRFWRGDDLRALHNHPFWFITFPFVPYAEVYEDEEGKESIRVVKAGRFHFRRADFKHAVLGRLDGESKPFWTFVIAGPRVSDWGFWPEKDKFVPWREWV